jgi:hypothetical protein
MLEGRCFCGAVRYQAEPPTDFAGYCHCESCRRATGAPLVGWTSVSEKRFHLHQGEPELRAYSRSPEVVWSFCGSCGTTLLYRSTQTPGRVYFTVASLTTALDRPLSCHASFEEKPDWFDMSSAVPRCFAKTDMAVDALHRAAEAGDLAKVGELLKAGMLKNLELDGWTPLMIAADIPALWRELLPDVPDPDYQAWLKEITSYPRLGYYLIRRVDIRSWRKLELPEEELLNRLFESFDDKAWPTRDQWARNQTWQGDYQLDATSAQELAVEVLAGGNSIGHTGYTIAPQRALELWRRFEAFFPPPRCYYQQLGLGDTAYAYLHGVAVVSQEQAGVLWVVESD